MALPRLRRLARTSSASRRSLVILAPLLVALVLLAVGSGRTHAQSIVTDRENPRALPLPDAPDAWQFVVFGDRTGGPADGVKVLAKAVAETNLLNPDLVMTVGDLIQGYNATRQWMPQMTEFRSIMDQLEMPWFPVAGNHDIYWRGGSRPAGHHEANYEQHFGPLWYWFRHENACFLVLYSDEGDPKTGNKGFNRPEHTQMSPAQLKWLEGALASNGDLDHVFVFLHHPRWDTPGSNWDEAHRRLVAAGNVTAVFAGHVHHMYYGGDRDGIEYFTLATTGGHLSRVAPSVGYLHHFHVVTVRDQKLSVAAVPVGELRDPRTLTQALVKDAGRLLFGSPPVVQVPAVLRSDGSAIGTYTVRFTNPTQVPVEVTLQPDSRNSGWRLWPDHEHARVAPGESAEASFRYEKAAGWSDRRYPELRIQSDYLGNGLRLSLPESRFPFALDLKGVTAAREPLHRVLTLDGRGDAASIPSDAASPPVDSAFTLEGWMRASRLKGRRPFLAKSESSEYYIFVTDGIPSFGVHLNGKYREAKSDQVVLQPSRWYHLAGVYDGKEVRLYVDGTVVAQSAASGRRRKNTHPLYLGADPNGRGRPVDFLAGSIDEIRLSVGARYVSEFTPTRWHEPDPSTLLLFHADQEKGPFLIDASSHRQHGRLIGDPQYDSISP